MYEKSLSDELEHYGVLGMKWGVRKDPKERYSKSVDKFIKKTKKANKARDEFIISEQRNIRKQVQRNKGKVKVSFSSKNRKLNKAYRRYDAAKKYAEKMSKKYEKYKASDFSQEDIDRGRKAAAYMINNFRVEYMAEELGEQLEIALLEKKP